LQDTVYAPEMKLVPTVEDNFVIGDIVHIRIKNKLVDIEGDYKVLSKSVSIEGEQKLMTLKINELPQNVANDIADLRNRVEVLENN